uniref:SDR family NAD(P)-dependent oxidoreductase n=1 Tax=Geotalea uraniireducens TaxID=351604 RepID=UPI00059E7D50
MAVKKIALITGPTAGIGYELSKLFAKDGYDLVLVSRDEVRLQALGQELKNMYGTQSHILVTDLANGNSPRKIHNFVKQQGISVDILVNNAGFQVYGTFSETPLDKELDMLHVHITGLTILTKLFLVDMLAKGSGRILNVGSTGSFVPGGPFNAVYCATKAYILSFSEAIAEELKGTNITVTTLCPGATATEFAKRANIEDITLFKYKWGVMDARTVARAGYDALNQGKRSIVPGFANKMTVYSIKFTPRRLMTIATKLFMSR